jgi:hypothetical protein
MSLGAIAAAAEAALSVGFGAEPATAAETAIATGESPSAAAAKSPLSAEPGRGP